MQKFISLLVLSLLSASTAFANPFTVDGNVAREGYSPFPVLQCPQITDRERDLIGKAANLKSQIRSDARCDEIASNIDEINQYMREEREKFLKLVEKGQTEELSEEESNSVAEYAKEVTSRISMVMTALQNNNVCFDEDKKESTLSLISGIVGEVSKVGAMTGDPVGMSVALTGQVVKGLLRGLDEIINNQRGYDFRKTEQQISYADSLCAYYDLRNEIQNSLNPEKSKEEYQKLLSALTEQLTVLEQNCEQCAEIIERFNDEVDDSRFNWRKFNRLVKNLVDEANSRFAKRLGTHTVKSLGTRQWLEQQIAAFDENQRNSNLSNSVLAEEVASLKDFLVDREGRRFVNYFISLSENNWNEMTRSLDRYSPYLVPNEEELNQIMKERVDYLDYDDRLALVYIDSLYGKNEISPKLVESYREQMRDLYRRTSASFEVAKEFCEFFQNAKMYANEYLHSVCEGRDMQVMTQRMKMVGQLKNGKNFLTPLSWPNNVVYASNWSDSLLKMVNSWLSFPTDYFALHE